MKTHYSYWQLKSKLFAVTTLALMLSGSIAAGNLNMKKENQTDTISYVQFKGVVVDANNNEPLIFATLSITGINIATVSNSEGEFILKVPKTMVNKSITASYIGYKSKEIPISELRNDKNRIKLEMISVSLSEINVFPKDPYYLISTVLNKRNENYMNDAALMTAFYRETIKKGWNYVSLSEAIVEILKQPYNGSRPDMVKMSKGRKSADYTKLDTLTFKLQGGPYTTLMLDIMKNPYLVFTDDLVSYYDFSLSNITRVNDKLIYVLDFKQREHVDEPLFYGKLYIDTESFAITNASYNLNVKNKSKATAMFILKKPAGANVFPTEAAYLVNYRQKNGKWYFGYSRGQVTFKVDWDKKLFNTNYYTTIEMAVTDWEPSEEKNFKGSERLKMNVIMQDAVSGFADKEFWGEYNVIEPEQSIETAIKKIQRSIEKNN